MQALRQISILSECWYGHNGSPGSVSKQLPNRLHPVIHERQRPVLRARQLAVRVEAEAAVERGGGFAGGDGPRRRAGAERVGLADDAAAAAGAAAHENRP